MEGKKFFEFSQITFKAFGLWTTDSTKNQTLKARFIKYTVAFLVGGIIPILSVSDTLATARTEPVFAVLIKALFGIAYSMCFHKLVTSASKSDEVISCIAQLESMANKFQEVADIKACLRGYDRMAKFDSFATNLCALAFMVAPAASRSLPYDPKLSYLDFSKWPNYEIMYIYQTVAVFTVANVMIAYDTIFCGLMYVCCGVFSSIRREIRQLDIDGGNHRAVEDKFKNIIDKIIGTTKIVTQISDIFSMTTMTSILYNSSVMAFGLLMVSFLPLSDLTCLTMIFCIVAVTFQMWIYCYFGQMVVDEKELLQRDLYCTNWYNGSRNFKTMILLTIFESQQQRYVKAGSVLPLCLDTFAVAVKKAYGFYAFFKQVAA